MDFPFPAGDGTMELIFDGPPLLGQFVPKLGAGEEQRLKKERR